MKIHAEEPRSGGASAAGANSFLHLGMVPYEFKIHVKLGRIEPLESNSAIIRSK